MALFILQSFSMRRSSSPNVLSRSFPQPSPGLCVVHAAAVRTECGIKLSNMFSTRRPLSIVPLVMRAIFQVPKRVGSLFPLDRSDRAQHISGRNTIMTSVKEVNTSRCWCLNIFKLGKARYGLKLGARAPAGATIQTAVEHVADRDGTGMSTNGRSQCAHGSQAGCVSVKATSVQLRRSEHATVGHAGHRPTGART